VRLKNWLTAAVIGTLLSGATGQAADRGTRPDEKLPSFGILREPAPDQAKAQAADWLKSVGKTDAATLKTFEEIWATDRSILEKVTKTLRLGDPAVATLLDEASDPDGSAPTGIPALLKDPKKPAFFRANITLAYAKALTGRRVFEEAIDAFKLTRPEDVADPASYLFHRAVAEHSLLMKNDAEETLDRLLVDAVDAPDRYRTVGALMHFDMLTWREKDLGWISRKMGVIKDRLDISRGGKKTQKMQKEVLVRIDEMIKEKENQQKGSSQANGGSCPSGQQRQDGPGSLQPGSPMQDSNPVTGQQGKGEVDVKKFKDLAENWGKLPDKEREKAMVELTQGMPQKYKDAIEAYFKELNRKSGSK
jgi:hypothetical protein